MKIDAKIQSMIDRKVAEALAPFEERLAALEADEGWAQAFAQQLASEPAPAEHRSSQYRGRGARPS